MTRHVWAILAAAGQSAASASVGAQPQGALSGKVVYLSTGHGWTADNLGSGAWFTQRGETFEIVEDLLNQDFQRFQADALWRAGATIVPLRPIGNQPIEVVLDNDDPGVVFTGAWTNSASGVFFGSPGDVPYRFALTTAGAPTARVEYRPVLPAAGHYPVYAWTLAGPDRVGQVYRVHHTGGVTEVRVDHRLVGGGWVYLGTHHFEAGDAGFVELTNQNATVGVVIADAIRFGNGMGDINRGAGVSGKPREDEAGLYWIERQAGVGIPSSTWRTASADDSATVSAPPRWAAWMNRSTGGTLADRVFLSHHSNAATGTARGVIALYNGNNNPATRTPNQFLLADRLAREVNDDMLTLNGSFEHAWAARTSLTLDRTDFEFGEISNLAINDEFDATIVERAFHDNQLDAELLRDARVNEAIARATVQGLIRYFNTIDGGATPLVMPPPPVDAVRAHAPAEGSLTVAWRPTPPGPAAGDAPTGYLVQTSTDGYGFDAGVPVAGGATLSATLTGLDPTRPVYVRVLAQNAGGLSSPSGVVVATPRAGGRAVLVVDGFDRRDRFLNQREPFGSGVIDRVRDRFQNSRDSSVQVGRALEQGAPHLRVAGASNEAVRDGLLPLTGYDAVVWILGEESSADDTFDATEQTIVSSYLASGGALFVSGAEIGWDLDFLGNGPAFYNGLLGADFVADDAGSYGAVGVAGSIFAGISAQFDDGDVFYNAEFPDVIAPTGTAQEAMRYFGGLGGGAAIQRARQTGLGPVVTLGFPFETILDPQDRAAMIARAMAFFGLGPCPADLTPTGSTAGTPDGVVDISDYSFYLTLWASADARADVTTTGTANGTPDGVVDISDFSHYLTLWSAGCP